MVIVESTLKITNTWWACPSCSILDLTRHFRAQIRFPTFSTRSSSAKALRYVEEESEDFLHWLEHKAGMEISSVLKIGKSAFGRALYASKRVRAGDCILRVPYRVQLAPDNLPQEIYSLLGDKVSNLAKVAVLLLHERKLGQESEWAPYIDRLPKLSAMHNATFWNDNELTMIEQSAVFKEAIRQRNLIKEEFLAIKPILDQFPASFEDVTLEGFMHAHSLVTSRAWESSRGVSMIPFADFLNHDGHSKSLVLSDEGKQFSEVIADSEYASGEQVLIRYGQFSNGTLLLDFGFTLADNIYDQVYGYYSIEQPEEKLDRPLSWSQVEVELNIPQHDNLRQMKLELLSRYQAPAIRDVDKSRSSEHIFTFKKVKSSDWKGRGIPQSFRAFARLVCVNSPEELSDLAKEASQNDGRLARCALKNKSIEIEAHQLMLSYITELISEYGTSLENVGQPPTSLHMMQRRDFRRQMAHDLLTGELSVLKSASVWLKNYVTSLSTA